MAAKVEHRLPKDVEYLHSSSEENQHSQLGRTSMRSVNASCVRLAYAFVGMSSGIRPATIEKQCELCQHMIALKTPSTRMGVLC